MQTTKYVIKYKLNGERRFEFAQLQSGSEEEARAALEKIHGDADDVITEIDRRWESFGIGGLLPSPSIRYRPLVGNPGATAG